MAVCLRWQAPSAPDEGRIRAVAALCATHPGPAPLYIDWSDGNGERLRARARRLRVSPDEELLTALKGVLGSDAVSFVKAG
jgi:hypothetical protein